MSMLVVDFGMESSFKSSLKKAKSELNNRISDYQNIEKRVNQIPGGSNVSNCSYYVRKKYQQLESKVEKLNTLNNQVTTFMDNALEADKRVASRIKSETKSFKKRTGIGKTSKSIWSSICETVGDFFTGVVDGAKEMWDGVKQWYEDNKYWIDVVVDAALFIGAFVAIFAASGVAAIVAACFFAFSYAADLFYDTQALLYYVDGDEENAERYSEKGGRDVFVYIGTKADEAFGTDFVAGTMGFVYDGLAAFAAIYTLCNAVLKPMKQMFKDLKLDKVKVRFPITKSGGKIKFRSIFHGNFDLESHFTLDIVWKATTNFFGANAVQQKNVVKLAYKLNKLGFKLTTGFAVSKLVLNTQRWVNGAKGIKDFYEKIDTTVDLIRNGESPFPKTQKTVNKAVESLFYINSGGVA